MAQAVQVRIDSQRAAALFKHLFPGDGDEHGAILAASTLQTARGIRLFVRETFLARDGVEYVHGQRGYKMLTAEFVREKAAWCASRGLAYLPVHNHCGRDTVGFSNDDYASHTRGYPALVGLLNAPVCALVFNENAAVGDAWFPDGARSEETEVVIAGKRIATMRASVTVGAAADLTCQRQSLLLGERGQDILRNTKVGVVGVGGVGSLLVEYLGRLGVGYVVVADPDRIEETNFSRIVGAQIRDYRPWWRWRKRTRKVDIAERVFIEANRFGRFEKIFSDFRRLEVVDRFIDCDYLFLAADLMSARLVFNQVVHQYLIPSAVIGAKAVVEKATGNIERAFSIVRFVTPGTGCLWCNGYISQTGLALEAASEGERRAQRYVDDPLVGSPSVITMNAVGASIAANGFLFGITGLGAPMDYDFLEVDALTGAIRKYEARRPGACFECTHSGRLGSGNSMRLTAMLA